MKRCLALVIVIVGVMIPGWADTPADSSVIRGSGEFACKLYRNQAKKQGNLFFSPFSISTALAMTAAGARGDTGQEMTSMLGCGPSPHGALGRVIEDITQTGAEYQLSIANRLWPSQDLPLHPEFVALVKKYYKSTVEAIRFDESARQIINAWVASQTQDKIKDILPAGAVSGDTRMVLTNAIYFKGNWKTAFDASKTRDRQFHLSKGKSVSTPMMSMRGTFRYSQADGLEVIELPYQGERLSMVIVLPPTGSLAAVDAGLSLAGLDKWVARLEPTELTLTIPRFRITFGENLNDALQMLGMKKAFGGADFSALAGSPGDLFLSAVLHKAFIDVNETGSEAAAATAVIVTRSLPPSNPEFTADHPFFFLIRDNKSGAILFMGRLENPKEGG